MAEALMRLKAYLTQLFLLDRHRKHVAMNFVITVYVGTKGIGSSQTLV